MPSRISTLCGIPIDQSDESEKSNDSIRLNQELSSNKIAGDHLHQMKHDDPEIAPFYRLLTHRSNEQEHGNDSIQTNHDFDLYEIAHSVEFHLVEVMMKKMHMT
jgi:hypothetical protein